MNQSMRPTAGAEASTAASATTGGGTPTPGAAAGTDIAGGRVYWQDLTRRQRKLAARPRCSMAWPDPIDLNEVHKCKKFDGHTTQHQCNCGSSRTRRKEETSDAAAAR